MRAQAEAVAIRSTAPVSGISVECIDSPWGFTALRPEWNVLLRASETDSPFLTWEWLHTWWIHLGGTARLRIAAVRSGSTLIGLAPFHLNARRVGLLSRLDLLGTGDAGSDYLDVILRRGYEDDAIRALARFALTQNATLSLRHLAPTAAATELADRLARAGWTSATMPDGVCPYIPLAGRTWDSYLATLGSSHRANVRRRLKAFAHQHVMSFDLVVNEAQRREALEALTRFHERRYAHRGGSTAFMTPPLQAFQDEATRRALDRGWLRLMILRANGIPAAVMYGFMYNRRFYFYQHGFDDRYRQQSVGLVLMALSIQHAISEGAEEFDMLWGSESYKSLWARDVRQLKRVQLFPAHIGGRIHRSTYTARRTLGSIARRFRTLTRRGAQ
jgi:CelD/BcsL family acetyltransferase involved in cellulose biosynthesis